MLKMNKSLWIFGLILLVCVMNVNATSAIATPRIAYNFSETSGTTVNDAIGTYTGLALSNKIWTPQGKIGTGIFPNITSDQWINVTGSVAENTENFSVNIWINQTSAPADVSGIVTHVGGSNRGWGLFGRTTTVTFNTYSGSGEACNAVSIPNAQVIDNNWHMITVVKNGGNCSIYLDGVMKSSQINTGYAVGTNNLYIGKDYLIAKGRHDEFSYWNVSLNQANISAIYANESALVGYPWGEGTTPPLVGNLTFNSQSPGNNTQYNYTNISYTINLTNQQVNETNIFVQCSLMANSVVLDSPYGAINGTGVLTTSSSTPGTGTIDYNWTCINQDEPSKNFTSSTYRFFVDTAVPTLLTNFSNHSIWLGWDTKSMATYWNFTDDQSLYSWNFTIYTAASTIFALQNTSLGGATKRQYILNIGLDDYFSPTPMLVDVKYCDGHTAEMLTEDYSIKTGLLGDVLQVSTKDTAISIKEKEASLKDEWSATEQIDRYTFTYTPERIKTEYIFVVNTDDELTIINRPDLKYKSWIVTGKQWIDFVPKNEPDFTISIKKISSKQAEVTVGNLKNPEKVEFESIGELNCVMNNFDFGVVNASADFESAQTETHTQSSVLTLMKSSWSENTSANFFFNTTNITSITKTEGTLYDIYNATFVTPLLATSVVPLKWNFTFYGTVNNVTDILNTTQSIDSLEISNCSLPTAVNTTSRRYTIYGADAITNVPANMTAVFQIWNGNRTATQHNFSLSWFNMKNATICIMPTNDEPISYDLSMIIASSGLATSTINEYNGTLTNVLSSQNVYLISAGSNFILKVIDQVSNPLAGYAVSEYEYDVTTDTEHFVSSLTTDINGNALFYYTATKQYRFIIKNTDGVTVLNTGLMYIIANPTTVKVDIAGTDFTTPNLAAWNLRTTLYNVSNTIYLNWTTLAGTSGTLCMNVTKVNATSSKALNGQCSSSSYGSMTYTFTEGDGTIKAVAWVKGSTFVTNILEIVINGVLKLWQQMGVSALIIYMIFIIIAVAISITNVRTMPFALMAAHVVSWWMGLIPGAWGFTVVVIAALFIVMDRVKD